MHSTVLKNFAIIWPAASMRVSAFNEARVLSNSAVEMCLDQELKALNQTGLWNDSYPPMSFDPTENVSFDFPVVLNKQVEMYIHFFQNEVDNRVSGRSMQSMQYNRILLPINPECQGW